MSEAQAVRVLVVDDRQLVREGIVRLLESSSDPKLDVREAAAPAAAIGAMDERVPDVVVMDVQLEGTDGLDLWRRIRARHPEVAGLFIGSAVDDAVLMAAQLSGAAGFLTTDVGHAELIDAVVRVAAGETLFTDDSVTDTLERLRKQHQTEPWFADLTRQEQRLFELVAQGLSNREIAEVLFLSEKTVKNYVGRLLSKLEMRRRTELVALWGRMAARRAEEPGKGRSSDR